MIHFDKNCIHIIGGFQNDSVSRKTWIVNLNNFNSENGGRAYPAPIPVIDTNNDPKEHSDEVFEAVVDDQIEVEEPTNSHPDESQEFSKQVSQTTFLPLLLV